MIPYSQFEVPLSIVIVTWNAKKYARECLTSLRQQCADLGAEIIVVDNASSDGTPELIREEFPEVRLIEAGANLGFAKGNNVGIRNSRGKYLALVNSDVNVPNGCLAAMLEKMEQESTIGVLGPRMRIPDGRVGRSYMRFPTVWNWFCRALALDSLFRNAGLFGGFLMTDFDNTRTADVDVLNGWFWMVRREALDKVDLLDERFFMYGEDIDWCRRFHQEGWRVVYFAGAEALHYGGASSSNAPVRFYIEMQRANIDYYRKTCENRLRRAAFISVTWLHHAIRFLGYTAVFLLKQSQRSEAAFKMKRSKACMLWLMGFKTT